MSGRNTGDRASAVERIIPRPPDDIAPMRTAFALMVSKQWKVYLPQTLAGYGEALPGSKLAKGRFIGEMYARACYSMLLVSRRGPLSLRAVVRASVFLPSSRGLTIKIGSALLAGMQHLLPRAVHQQLLLTSAPMGGEVTGTGQCPSEPGNPPRDPTAHDTGRSGPRLRLQTMTRLFRRQGPPVSAGGSTAPQAPRSNAYAAFLHQASKCSRSPWNPRRPAGRPSELRSRDPVPFLTVLSTECAYDPPYHHPWKHCLDGS